MEIPLSPVTGSSRVTLEENFSVAEILQAYQAAQLDVSEYFTGLTQVQLFRCNDTGYRFFYPYSIIGRSSLYDQLQKTEGYYPAEKWEHTEALKHIQTTDNVLEVGCGNGNFLEKLKAKGVSQAKGLDFSDDALRAVQQKGLQGKKESLQSHATTHAAQYDVVCFFQVLEHIDNIAEFMNAAASVLKPNGKMIVGVPNSNPYLYRYDRLHTLNLPPHHMGLWNSDALRNLAPHFGLDVVAVATEDLPWQYRSQYRKAFIGHYQKHNPLIAKTVAAIPAFVFKSYLSVFNSAAEGRHLLAIYRKK